MSWDYDLAKRIKQGQGQRSSSTGLEGKVEKTSPLTICLYGGEVMAPPAELILVDSLRGVDWDRGDRVVCIWMGKALVVLGRIS